ncbi:MAG: SurA N-terminal domain-containing protein [Legionella sp.]
MLQKLNERIQGVLAWVVIILIAITFALFGIDYYIQSRQNSTVQADVNGQSISKQDYDISYRRTRQLRDPSTLTAANESELKKQVLDDMVTNLVSVQAAHQQGFEVNAAQADAAILSIPQFQEDGHFSSDRYQQALSGAFFTHESFQKEVKQGMLLNQQRFVFMGTAFALPSEIERFVKLYMQTRDYKYWLIPSSPFVDKTNISLDEVTSYYQKHLAEFLSPEKITIDYVRLSMQAIKSGIKLSDEQVLNYYNENQSNFYTPAQWQVAHILFAVPDDASDNEQQQIKEHADQTYQLLKKNPDQFDNKVATLSDDKLSVTQKGILPWIVAGSSDFDKALVNLTTVGQISEPVQTKYGYEIFKLIHFNPATIKPYHEVKHEIAQQMLAELVQSDYARALEQLSDLSYQTPDSLKPVADALHLSIEHSQYFSRQGGTDWITKHKQIINTAYSRDVLELGNNSEPVQIDNDGVVVLRVNKHIAETQKTLDQVKPAIIEKLAKLKAELKAKALADELLKLSNHPIEFNKTISNRQLEQHVITKATRDSDNGLEVINELAFGLPRPATSSIEHLDNGDYVLVTLDKINDGVFNSLDNEQKASLKQQIEASFGLMDYDLYINSLLADATITKN